MKTTKTLKIAVLLLALHCIIAIVLPTSASEIQPRVNGIDVSDVSISIDKSGQAVCSVFVTAKSSSYQIEVIMSLHQLEGNGPDPLKSWTINGVGSLSGSKKYYVARGYDYQVMADITVKDSRGNIIIDSFSTPSAVVHY